MEGGWGRWRLRDNLIIGISGFVGAILFPMRRTVGQIIGFVTVFLLPFVCHADPVEVPGVASDIEGILNGFVDVLYEWALPVATAAFLFGAFVMAASGGEEAGIGNGKKIMKGALIGLAITMGAYMIVSTAVSFLTG